MESVLLHLNTSADSFVNWLLGRYAKGELPLDVKPWVLLEPRTRGFLGTIRIDLAAILDSPSDDSAGPRSADQPEGAAGQESKPDEPPAAVQVFRFDAFDIGTQRDGRVEVDAQCHSSSEPLRWHFYAVLAQILGAWPEALQDLQAAFHSYARGYPGIAIWVAKFHGEVHRPAAGPPWMQIRDKSWYRFAVRLVHEGYNSNEIARRIGGGLTAKTVRNRLCKLRKIHGPQIVPPLRTSQKKP